MSDVKPILSIIAIAAVFGFAVLVVAGVLGWLGR